MEQVALIPSGVQPYCSHTTCAVGAEYLCYASTLAVYVHSNMPSAGHPLVRVLNGPDKAIVGIACDKNVIAAACAEGDVFLWTVSNGALLCKQKLEIMPRCIAASESCCGHIFIGGADLKGVTWAYTSNRVQEKSFCGMMDSGDLSCAAFSALHPNWCGIGTSRGRLVIYDVTSNEVLKDSEIVEVLKTGGFWDRVFSDDLSIVDVAFDPLSDNYLLVAASTGEVLLVDIEQPEMSVMQQFERSNTGITRVVWLPTEPGTFLSCDGQTNAVKRWNVSTKSPTGVYRPSTVPVRTLTTVPPDYSRCFVGFDNGSVGIYHLSLSRIDSTTLPGHCESVFDCRFSNHSPDIFASASFDQTIKIWNVKKMELQSAIYARHVVYSVAWSADGKQIAAGLGSGEVGMFDVASGKQIWKQKLHSDSAWKVDWSSRTPELLASTSKDGTTCAFSASTGKAVWSFAHPKSSFGLCFSPHDGPVLMATGCHDNLVRVFDLEKSAPVYTLSGHENEVYNVAWSPFHPHLIASGSNDKTVRVHNIAKGTTVVLVGHTNNVRALSWSRLSPNVLVSGGWDGTIRVWDVKTGSEMAMVHHHGADVYAVDSHPQRPLIFVSGSRDTTIRLWVMNRLVYLRMAAYLNTLHRHIAADPVKALEEGSGIVAAGPGIQALQLKLSVTNNALERVESIADFFEFPCGAADVVHCIRHCVNPSSPTSSNFSHDCTVIPVEVLCTVAEQDAKKIETGVRARIGSAVGSSKENAKRIAAADAYFRLGKVKEYCELMTEAGEWERALAAAPMLGMEYWRTQCLVAADRLAAAGDRRAVDFYICACEAYKAADFLAKRREFCEAMMVVMQCPQRSTGSQSNAPAIINPPQASPLEAAEKLKMYARERSQVFEVNGNPGLAAAALISAGFTDMAIEALVRGSVIPLSYGLVHVVGLSRNIVDDVLEACMWHCMCLDDWEGAAMCGSSHSWSFEMCASLHASWRSTHDISSPSTTMQQLIEVFRANATTTNVFQPKAHFDEDPQLDVTLAALATNAVNGCFNDVVGPAAQFLDYILKIHSQSVNILKAARLVTTWAVIHRQPGAAFSADEQNLLIAAFRVGICLAEQSHFSDLIPPLAEAALKLAKDPQLRDALTKTAALAKQTTFVPTVLFGPMGCRLPSRTDDGSPLHLRCLWERSARQPVPAGGRRVVHVA